MSQTRVFGKCAIGCLVATLACVSRAKSAEFPPDCSVDVRTEAIHPARVPIQLTLTLTNKGEKPIIYCGFGDYPDAGWFMAQITDGERWTHKAKLSNDQGWNVSGVQKRIEKGKSIDIPAFLEALPVGRYNIQVGNGRSARVTVKEDPEVANKWEQHLLAKIRQGDAFSIYVASAYFASKDPRKSLIDALLHDLLSNDQQVAERAALPLGNLRQLPPNSTRIITNAMDKHIALEKQQGSGKTLILLRLAGLAATIGTDEALQPVLTLARTEMRRGAAIWALGKFKQEKAAQQLRSFLQDQNEDTQFPAAQALAGRKDPAALEVLLAVANDPKSRWRAYSFESLLKYPDDPRVEPAIKGGLNDPDSFVRGQAEFALGTLRPAKKP